MSTLMQANQQWSSRPADERFVSLHAMADQLADLRERSREVQVSSRRLHVAPAPGDEARGLVVSGANGIPYAPSNWAFGQLAQLGGAPAGYLRGLPAPLAADCLNWGLHRRDVADVGVLISKGAEESGAQLRAATGPRYGRIWNADVAAMLSNRFGDGVSGEWRVPGEFGRPVEVTKANTTLYAGDRDMFVFLCDESRLIEMRNRRDGQGGALSRGFFVWNSEVGSATFGVSTFLYDYVCANRIVWGAKDVKTMTLRHSSGAPDRFAEEALPALESYAAGSSANIVDAIEDARAHRLDDVSDFLAKRYGPRSVAAILATHEREEGRPIESRWDVVVARTAMARDVAHQDERVAIEREAGLLLDA